MTRHLIALFALASACSPMSPADGGVPDAGLVTDGGVDAGAAQDGGLTDGGAGHVPLGLAIPPPGPGMNQWGPNQFGGDLDGGYGTPQTAWQVGTLTMPPQYVGATLNPQTGNVFWVFLAGAGMTELHLSLFPNTGPIEYAHLHSGAGGVLGALITPTAYTAIGGRVDARWPITPGQVYVVEVHGIGGIQF